MGWTPRDVDACSLWQFHAAYAGWARANGAEVGHDLSAEEFEAASEAYDAAPETSL